jgi:DnaJ-class molecular chaperone
MADGINKNVLDGAVCPKCGGDGVLPGNDASVDVCPRCEGLGRVEAQDPDIKK